MSKHDFAPKPAPITLAVWQYLGRLHPLILPTSGAHWGVYAQSGGPQRYMRAGRK